MKQVDVLIIGQGLAGSLLAMHLTGEGKSVLVMDSDEPVTSSKVAAGMFNPVSPKRMTLSWMAEETMPYAISFYRQFELRNHCHIIHEQPVYQVFGSIKEQNDLMSNMENPLFAKYINPDPAEIPYLKQPFGAIEVNHCGWLDTNFFLPAARRELQQAALIANEKMDYSLLEQTIDGLWQYKGHHFNQVVFCEGHQCRFNPFFSFIKFKPAKGEVLTIRCEGLERSHILKKGVYIVPVSDNLFKVGATYHWNDLTAGPGEEGLQELKAKLNDMLDTPYTIVKHEAGIRPTIHDRKPVLGEHPALKNLFVFNGLGTRGVMLGPYFAQLMAKLITGQKEIIPADCSVNRFVIS